MVAYAIIFAACGSKKHKLSHLCKKKYRHWCPLPQSSAPPRLLGLWLNWQHQHCRLFLCILVIDFSVQLWKCYVSALPLCALSTQFPWFVVRTTQTAAPPVSAQQYRGHCITTCAQSQLATWTALATITLHECYDRFQCTIAAAPSVPLSHNWWACRRK